MVSDGYGTLGVIGENSYAGPTSDALAIG